MPFSCRFDTSAVSRVPPTIVFLAAWAAAASADPAGREVIAPTGADFRHTAASARREAAVAPSVAAHLTLSGRARDLQAEVSAWLREELGLPAVPYPPAIVFVPDGSIGDQRFRDVPGEPPGVDDADVLAVYDDDTRTIYLPEGWSADRAVGGSILVHETVHHVQNLSGETFACPEAREAAAFAAQDRWLNRFGNSLEQAFGIDGFTVLARSMCGW
jgi:hypothetical protein